jgi:nucleoside phosphorylase
MITTIDVTVPCWIAADDCVAAVGVDEVVAIGEAGMLAAEYCVVVGSVDLVQYEFVVAAAAKFENTWFQSVHFVHFSIDGWAGAAVASEFE